MGKKQKIYKKEYFESGFKSGDTLKMSNDSMILIISIQDYDKELGLFRPAELYNILSNQKLDGYLSYDDSRELVSVFYKNYHMYIVENI